jgi:hypothetical protein
MFFESFEWVQSNFISIDEMIVNRTNEDLSIESRKRMQDNPKKSRAKRTK